MTALDVTIAKRALETAHAHMTAGAKVVEIGLPVDTLARLIADIDDKDAALVWLSTHVVGRAGGVPSSTAQNIASLAAHGGDWRKHTKDKP